VLVDLQGGPWDGHTVERSGKEPYLWIDAEGRAHGVARADATVYRLWELRRRRNAVPSWRYVFVGHGVQRCGACGWFGPRAPSCLMCGAVVE
jgi:hypothetical protein